MRLGLRGKKKVGRMGGLRHGRMGQFRGLGKMGHMGELGHGGMGLEGYGAEGGMGVDNHLPRGQPNIRVPYFG
jgi:hypothetical protein